MPRDRRSTERQPVGFYVEDVREANAERYFASDLSVHGVYLERPHTRPLRGSQPLQLEIRLPSERESIWAQAEVVYERSDALFQGYGVRFTALPEQHAKRLQRWLQTAARTEQFITHPARRASREVGPNGVARH